MSRNSRKELLDYLRSAKCPVSPIEAAKALDTSNDTIRKMLTRLVDEGLAVKAVRGLYAHPDCDQLLPEKYTPPGHGFITKGTSTLYDKEGNAKLTWVKEAADAQRQEELLRETIAAFMEPLRGIYKPTKAPKVDTADYMTSFPIGDCHIGLRSWGEQTGTDWDTSIAESAICSAMNEIIGDAPSTDECWIWQLGDFMHIDSDAGATTAGTPQDHDGRYAKIVYAAVRCIRFIIERSLAKHRTVNIINAKGNHDENAAVALDVAVKAAYENEPRLILHDSPKRLFIHRWHSNLFGITHGHKPKPRAIPGNMANDAPEDWGASKNRYAHHGHFHAKERGMFQDLAVEVECHSAPTAPDDWTIGMGYRSTSEVKAIVYHKDEGEKRRYTSKIRRKQ